MLIIYVRRRLSSIGMPFMSTTAELPSGAGEQVFLCVFLTPASDFLHFKGLAHQKPQK